MYKGVLDCVRTMYAQEGPRSFYRGLGQRALYMGPLWAIQFMCNEYALKEMQRRNELKAYAAR